MDEPHAVGGGKALVQLKDISIEELPPTPKREGAAEPKKSAKVPPLSPADERAAFSLAPGLEMELVVEEDLDKGYGKFVAVQFDQQGRLWTMTAREYPVDANENPGAADALYASKAQDRILIYDVENRGGNGQPISFAKEPSVFADGLAIPLGILPYKDGCYTQHGHDIVFLRDTDGDGKSDKREVILTGFGVQDSHLFPHQFTRAPGGWLWLAQGAFNYSKVTGPEGKITPFDQTRMAKFRPDGAEFTITSNGPCNIWGLAMNGEGETFIQEANDFGYPVMPFHEYGNYPGCSNAQWKSYGPEFPNLADFRMGGTGLSGLALTDASGSFPAEWSDVMLVANPIINRIQAIKMHRNGDGWRLERLPDVVASEGSRPKGIRGARLNQNDRLRSRCQTGEPWRWPVPPGMADPVGPGSLGPSHHSGPGSQNPGARSSQNSIPLSGCRQNSGLVDPAWGRGGIPSFSPGNSKIPQPKCQAGSRCLRCQRRLGTDPRS